MTAATTRLTGADLARRARLSPDESQQAFRALLDGLARPGRLIALPPSLAHRMPPALVPAVALADVEVTMAVLGGADEGWADAVRHATGARIAPLALAQMIVCLRAPSPPELAALERGDADSPERGARVSIACRSLRPLGGEEPGCPGIVLALQGPGVDGTAHVVVAGIDPEVPQALAEINCSFPAGIDVWLVADDGHLVGLPRSTSVAVLAAHDPDAAPPTDHDHDHDHEGAR